MSKANYIIFHPDRQRQKVAVKATASVHGQLQKNWKGDIWVDKIRVGNEDPFVFSKNWLYSYCHASQLKRKPSTYSLQKGSWLVFCSGESANDGVLSIDTVFKIGNVYPWKRKPSLELPDHFQNESSNESEIWTRHLQFPFKNQHGSVTFTYEAAMGKDQSFLPLTDGIRTSISFENFPKELRNKIAGKVKGKYPVPLSDAEMKIVLNLIYQKTDTQVIQNIKPQIKSNGKNTSNTC